MGSALRIDACVLWATNLDATAAFDLAKLSTALEEAGAEILIPLEDERHYGVVGGVGVVDVVA